MYVSRDGDHDMPQFGKLSRKNNKNNNNNNKA
jgi:hypothetical protein